ncbi:MAG: ATP-dependent helicase [Planctomycetia bacterium]|nr:ATP-dependent helicase [Planctomycetia bacterium]
MPNPIFDNLNPQQQEAVQHGESPLLVVAGAGAGKTTMLAHRVAFLISQGALPEKILLLTFTRRAAGMLVGRARDLLFQHSIGESTSTAGIWGGTFHAVATRLLRVYGQKVGLPPNFTIVDRADQEDIMNLVRAETLASSVDKKRFPKKGTCVSIYSRVINSQEKLHTILAEHYPAHEEFRSEIAKVFDAYVARKREDAVLDYDDLLLYWNALMSVPGTGEFIRKKFDWILVDEYQDTNLIQANIIQGLSPDGRGLTVVGDDAQSIYSFRAATVRNILDMPSIYPDLKVVLLEQNYRSVNKILKASNKVVAQLKERYKKNLVSTRDEGEMPIFVRCRNEDAQSNYIVTRVLESYEKGVPLREQAVLFRAASHSTRLEAELVRRRIPYIKYGGLKFTEAAHVKDLLAILRLAENPTDATAGLRFLTLLPGIGPRKAQTLLLLLRESGGSFNAWRAWTPPKPCAKTWEQTVDLLQKLVEEDLPLNAQVEETLKLYKPFLLEKYPNDAESRLVDLQQLADVSGKFRSRRDMLADFVLDPPQSSEDFAEKPDIDDDYLVLSTIHSAKGLEWRDVFIIHASDGNIPSDMSTGKQESIDEELRLFYVAMTRARDHLYITCPMQYFHVSWYGDYSRVLPTRFLPKRILSACFAQETFNDDGLEEDSDVEEILEEEGLTLDRWIRNQTQGLWGE